MRLWKSLWDIKLWEGSEDDVNSILHYILFFRAGLNNLSDVSEVEFNWREGLSEADRELYAKRIKEIKEDIATNGFIITREISKCMANSPHAELHLTIPYDIKRDSSHCWDSEAISAIIRAHTVSFLKDDDSKLQKFVYTIQRYGAISYYLDKGCCALNGKDIYISFIVMPTGESDSCIVISCKKLSDYQKVWLYYISQYQRHKHFQILISSVKSAIGSIMSRNGSHNIGSHVLAALSHNVGTMPDDRLLYQYIQQRMDYIANVTTESPSWSQPTMLVGELMRTFLSQRHLLNHIAESEGLSAWEFQNQNKIYDDSQRGKIKIHVRKVKRVEGSCAIQKTHDFIKYKSDEIDAKIDLADDVAVAIPGGIAGQHAFFTIIENIIRNAAKHDWSNPPPSTKHIKETGNLELYIDFEDKEAKGLVEFNIWTNMSDILEDPSAEGNVESEKALHKQLAKKLAVQFIDDSGSLRRANWGLAEMKISAGYLQGRRIAEIGGIDENFNAKDIIDPQYIEDNGVKHLAYRFCVPKPKMMLFLLNGEKDAENVVPAKWKKYESEFKRRGIYAKTYSEVLEEARRDKLAFPKLDYEYVIMDKMEEGESKWFLPFRVMTITPTTVEGAKQLVHNLQVKGWESCVAILNNMLSDTCGEADEAKIKATVDKILACWCKFMKSRHMATGEEPLNLVLTVKEDNANSGQHGGAGKGLISKSDVVRFVFEEMLHSIIRLFREQSKEHGKAIDKEMTIALDKLAASNQWAIDTVSVHGTDYMSCIKGWIRVLSSDEATNSRYNLLSKRINEIANKGLNANVAEIKEKRQAISEKIDIEEKSIAKVAPFIDYVKNVCEQMEAVLCRYAENIASLPSGYGSDCNDSKDNCCVEWKDAGLHFWKGNRNIGGDVSDFAPEELGKGGLYEKSKEIAGNYSFEFIRHYDPNTEKAQEKRLYAEPLSGSQSYFNILERCTINDKRSIAKLIETASLRILIIDERVAKFYREHANEVARTYRSMHIYVADDKKVDDELLSLANPPKRENNADEAELVNNRWQSPNVASGDSDLIPLSALNILDGRRVIDATDASSVNGHTERLQKLIDKFTFEGKKLFDVLIIHQGIIDKWFPGTANDSKLVEKLLNYLRQIFPYVVITTGRGSPANIPDMARMVPFSTIETTLFKKYPEKMLLVDAIMNVLPKGATENG